MWSMKGFGLVVGHYAGKQKDLASVPFDLSSPLSSKVWFMDTVALPLTLSQLMKHYNGSHTKSHCCPP